jgi:hypothetical protein
MPDAALREAARHRQGPRAAHSRDCRDRRHAVPAGAPRRLSSYAAGPAAAAGRGPQDGQAALRRAWRRLARHARGRLQGWSRQRPQGHGRQEAGAHSQGDRGAQALRGTAPGGPGREGCARGRLSLEGVVPRRGLHAGRQPPPGRRHLRRPRHPRRRRATGRDGHVHLAPRSHARPRARRHEVQRAARHRPAGRPPPGGTQVQGRRPAVFHRLEGPQHRAARSSAGPRPPPQRVRLVQRGDRRVAGRRG